MWTHNIRLYVYSNPNFKKSWNLIRNHLKNSNNLILNHMIIFYVNAICLSHGNVFFSTLSHGNVFFSYFKIKKIKMYILLYLPNALVRKEGGYSKFFSRRESDNAIARTRKKTKQIPVHKILHRKLKTELSEPFLIWSYKYGSPALLNKIFYIMHKARFWE